LPSGGSTRWFEFRRARYARRVSTTTVVVRQITEGAEAERILDALDATVKLPSDRLSNGRRYMIQERTQTGRAEAVAALEAELDKISGSWATHVAIKAIK
jgi:hypothetical protein